MLPLQSNFEATVAVRLMLLLQSHSEATMHPQELLRSRFALVVGGEATPRGCAKRLMSAATPVGWREAIAELLIRAKKSPLSTILETNDRQHMVAALPRVTGDGTGGH